MNNERYVSSYSRVNGLMHRIFGWMTYALTLTALVAYSVAIAPALQVYFYMHPGVLLMLVALQLGVVVTLSAFIDRISFSLAFFLFTIYSLMTGIVISPILLVYTGTSVTVTFVTCAVMFATMALYGAFTKADLTTLGSFLYMALWGLMLSMIINFFVQSSAFQLLLSMIGVVIFAGLTASDVQRLQAFAAQVDPRAQDLPKVSILGALILYLDFINLFLNLLRLMGQRKAR